MGNFFHLDAILLLFEMKSVVANRLFNKSLFLSLWSKFFVDLEYNISYFGGTQVPFIAKSTISITLFSSFLAILSDFW